MTNEIANLEKFASVCGTSGIATASPGPSSRGPIHVPVVVDGDGGLMLRKVSNSTVAGRLSGTGVVSVATGATAVGLVHALIVGVASGRSLLKVPIAIGCSV